MMRIGRPTNDFLILKIIFYQLLTQSQKVPKIYFGKNSVFSILAKSRQNENRRRALLESECFDAWSIYSGDLFI